VWVQLPAIAGVAARPLRRGRAGIAAGPGLAAVPQAAVWVEGSRAGNGLLELELGPAGLEQLRDAQGRPQLRAPLAWRRFGDRGEFWDAWDLAADHADHPLPWQWQGEPQWWEQGPLCARFVWHGRCGDSPVRLDGRLLAGTPWLELVLGVHWRQRHELLRLEVPLADRADRWAADTAGGVLERPAQPRTAREQARWEVAAISWLASCAPQGGLAVLLDGPQGVSGQGERLGVSLLRAPTWPDPGADNGWQRQRLALLPCAAGWRADGVPAQAQAFREPLWLRPAAASQPPPPELTLPPLPVGVEMVGLRYLGDGTAALALANHTPCRQEVDLGPAWQVLARLDGLDNPVGPAAGPKQRLGPWQLEFRRIRPA
jgi:alpha-mannosidase